MTYIDGFVIAVPTARKADFEHHARTVDSIFFEYGALRVTECWGDDIPEGETTDFRRAVKATPDETIVFSWIEWPDKASREDGMKRMMEDPRFASGENPMPFDGKRMIFGGFRPLIDMKKPR